MENAGVWEYRYRDVSHVITENLSFFLSFSGVDPRGRADRSPKNLEWRQCRREGGQGRAAAASGTLQGRNLRGENLEFLAFALQYVSVSLYLFFLNLVHCGWVLPVGGVAPRTIALGGKNPRAATECGTLATMSAKVSACWAYVHLYI